MARCLLVGKAVAGIVTAVDREHREVVTTNRARRRAAGRAIARPFWGDGGQLGGGQHLTCFGRDSRLLTDLTFCIASEFRGAHASAACAPPFRPVRDARDQAQQRGKLSPAMFGLFMQQLRLRPARRLPIAFGWLTKRGDGPPSGGCGRS